jgi:hypothetical protein
VRVDAAFDKGERDMLGDRYVVVHGDNLWRVAVKPVSVRLSVSSSSR